MRKNGLVFPAVLSFLAVLGAMPAQAQPPNEGAVGYIEAIESSGVSATGVDEEVDAAAVQAETAREGDASPGVSDSRHRRLEEIVVSARRRDEFLEDTPISVSAISAETFVEAQITQFNQLSNIVPNLQISSGRSGFGGGPTIRGVAGTESGNPGAGTYVDGIFLQRSGSSILNVGDVQQLEVLRGPQGTLFGKNTLGGAINITTVAPAQELSGDVWLRAGNYGSLDTRATIDVPIDFGPLADKVFTRFSFSSQHTDGYTTNVAENESYNNRSAYWVLGKVRILPIDDLEVNINANYFQSKSRGAGGECYVVDDAEASLKGLLLAANPDFYEKCRATTPYTFGTFLDTLFNNDDYGVWGNIKYDFGQVGFMDELSVKLLGSWRRSNGRNRQDIDLTVDDIVELSNVSIGEITGDPYEAEDALIEVQTYGQALDGRLNVVGGFFASWLNSSVGNLVATNQPTLDHIGGFTYGPVTQDDHDWAFYSQATYDVTEILSLTGGIRYTSETRGISRASWYPLGDGGNIGVPTCIHEEDAPCVTTGDKTFTQWTPMGSLQLFAPDSMLDEVPIDHLMGYFSYAKGFSSGGFNAVIGASAAQGGLLPYDPALLDNFEIGVKTVAFDQRMTMNLSLFLMNYDNMQVTTSKTFPCTPIPPATDCVPTTQRVIDNAASSEMRGLELEMTLRPIEGLLIQTNIGVLDARYLQFEDTWLLDSVTEVNRAGETFNGVPEFSSYLAVQYSMPIDLASRTLSGWLTPRVDWSYRTKTHNTYQEDASGRVPPYSLLNLRLSYDFMNDRAQVALWGRNVTSSKFFNGGGGTTGFFGYSQRYYAAPATYGAELSYRFS
jgi:iron complex outermembrane receptor protein